VAGLERYPAPRVGGLEQPAIKLPIKIADTLITKVRCETRFFNLNGENMIANLLDQYPMLLFVAEGAIALGLLLFIVLWTGKGKK
jgi:hypothetical protein